MKFMPFGHDAASAGRRKILPGEVGDGPVLLTETILKSKRKTTKSSGNHWSTITGPPLRRQEISGIPRMSEEADNDR